MINAELARFQRYDSERDFYDADETRLRSEEADYGCHWSLSPHRSKWRVSYVRRTGEIYAVYLGQRNGPLFVIGHCPPDPVDETLPYHRQGLWYRTLETVLDGWAEQCAKPSSLRWVVEKLGSHQKHIIRV